MQRSLFSQIQRILLDSFDFSLSQFKQIITLCLPFIFAVLAFDLLLSSTTHELSPLTFIGRLAIEPFVYSIYMGGLIQLMARRAGNERPQNSDLILAAIQQWAPFLALRMIELLLIVFGFQFLILPAIWLMVRLAFAEFHLVLFKIPPWEAVKRSFLDTRTHFWLVFTLLVVISVPFVIILTLIIGRDPNMILTNNNLRIGLNVTAAFFEIFVRIALFRTFMQVVSEQQPPHSG
jgi:hypothetical protein